MQILYEAELQLQDAGFQTAPGADLEELLVFENDSILGFVVVHDSTGQIIHRWRDQQDAFLRRYASRLRKDPRKAWSTYSIFLSSAPTDDQSRAALLAIEEDFSATRKIAMTGIITRDDVRRALSPLLPLNLTLQSAPRRPETLLMERLDGKERALFAMVSDVAIDETQILNWLLREQP